MFRFVPLCFPFATFRSSSSKFRFDTFQFIPSCLVSCFQLLFVPSFAVYCFIVPFCSFSSSFSVCVFFACSSSVSSPVFSSVLSPSGFSRSFYCFSVFAAPSVASFRPLFVLVMVLSCLMMSFASRLFDLLVFLVLGGWGSIPLVW